MSATTPKTPKLIIEKEKLDDEMESENDYSSYSGSDVDATSDNEPEDIFEEAVRNANPVAEKPADNEEDEYDEMAKQMAELQKKMAQFENRKKIKANIAEYRKVLINNAEAEIEFRRLQVEELNKEIKKFEDRIEIIKDASPAELEEKILETQSFQDILFSKTKTETKTKPKTETKTKKAATKSKTETKPKRDIPKNDWNAIAEGTKFELIYNKSGKIYRKKGTGLVDAAGNSYKSLNDVVKKYKASIGDTKGFGSAWNLFRIV